MLSRLRNEVYVGTIVYNRTSSKLKTPKRHNPPEEWIRSTEAFDGLVTPDSFFKPRNCSRNDEKNTSPEFMLQELECSGRNTDCSNPRYCERRTRIPSSETYAKHFGSFDAAFQQLHLHNATRPKLAVQEEIAKQISQVLNYSDFLVLDQKLSLSIQPAVPVPHGYTAYWPIQPDASKVIDITLGVLLSEWIEPEILGLRRTATRLRRISDLSIWIDFNADRTFWPYGPEFFANAFIRNSTWKTTIDWCLSKIVGTRKFRWTRSR